MKIPLEPDKYYHIYNHANGFENLFVNKGNYKFFLTQYIKHVSPIAKTVAYCLMPNHFHLAVKIRTTEELKASYISIKKQKEEAYALKMGIPNHVAEIHPIEDENIPLFLSKQFSNFFSSYTQAFNKQQDRMGSLFIPNFGRKHIHSDEYLKQIVHYIHFNPVHHGFVTDIMDWEHSSFQTYLSDNETFIERGEMLQWFGGSEDFLLFHNRLIKETMALELESLTM